MYSIPAAVHVLFNQEFRLTPKEPENQSLEVAKCLVYAGEVFILTILFGKTLFAEKKGHEFYLYYAIATLAFCFLALLFNFIIYHSYLKIKNKIYHRWDLPEETTSQTSWATVFTKNKLLNSNNVCVAIYKNNDLITAGLVYNYPSLTHPNRDFLLYQTDHIQNILHEDELKEEKDRVFEYSNAEYYDVNNNMLIKFYSLEKYNKTYN